MFSTVLSKVSLPRWVALGVLCAFGLSFALTARSQTGKRLIDALSQALIREKIELCERLLETPKGKVIAHELAFTVLKQKKSAFSFPEDRLALELSVHAEDPVLEVLSGAAQSQAKEILKSSAGIDQLLEALAESSSLGNDLELQDYLKRFGGKLGQMIQARDKKDFDRAILIYETEFPEELQNLEFTRQQLAFCLNRRKKPGDQDRAEKVLRGLIEVEGRKTGENFGLLARIYKDRFDQESKQEEKAKFLDLAIQFYYEGMVADPMNYYPGINAVLLRLVKGSEEALREMEDLIPVVQFALKRAQARSQKDYWILDSMIALAILRRNWDEVSRLKNQVLKADSAPWMLKSSVDMYSKVAAVWSKSVERSDASNRAPDLIQLGKLIEDYQAAMSPRVLEVSPRQEPTPTVVSSLDTESLILNTRINVQEELRETGVSEKLRILKDHSKGIWTVHDFLRDFQEKQNGYLLGLTQEHHKTAYRVLSQLLGLQNWWNAYQGFGLDGDQPGHIQKFMQNITTSGLPVVFLVPRNMHFSQIQISHTGKEFEWIADAPDTRAKNVYFVLGAHRVFEASLVNGVIARNGSDKGQDILTALLRSYRTHLRAQP